MPDFFIPIIGILIVAFIAVAIYASSEIRAETKRTGKHPKGHYMSRGVGVGVAIGVAIGTAMGNVAIGIPIGIAIGIGIGTTQEKKHADELRPMTEKEKRAKQRGLAAMVGLLISTMLLALALYWMRA
jgi:hypothetical protein